MAQKLDPKEIVSIEEVLLANEIQDEALVNLLVKKGIITKAEIIEEIKRLKEKYLK